MFSSNPRIILANNPQTCIPALNSLSLEDEQPSDESFHAEQVIPVGWDVHLVDDLLGGIGSALATLLSRDQLLLRGLPMPHSLV